MPLTAPKLRAIASIFLALTSTCFASPVLFLPHAGVNLYPGLLEPSTTLGEAGLGLHVALGGAEAGGSGAALTGALPLFRSLDPRSSGWVWGFAIGMTDFSYIEGEVLSPSSYFYELGLGRGTMALTDENNTGLRGSFEVALRDQLPRLSADVNAALTATGNSIPAHNYSLVLRLGAATDVEGHGVVSQKPPKIGYALYADLYLPILSDTQALLITVQARGMMRCFAKNMYCGADFMFLDSRNKVSNPTDSSEPMEYGLTGGLLFRYRLDERYIFELSPRFSFLTAAYRAVISKLPYLQAGVEVAF